MEVSTAFAAESVSPRYPDNYNRTFVFSILLYRYRYRYPLPATRYPLPATRYPLPATRYPLPATRHRNSFPCGAAASQ